MLRQLNSGNERGLEETSRIDGYVCGMDCDNGSVDIYLFPNSSCYIIKLYHSLYANHTLIKWFKIIKSGTSIN